MLHCNIISHWLGTYTKWSLCLSHTANTMVAYDRMIQGARASTAMALNQLSRNYPVSALQEYSQFSSQTIMLGELSWLVRGMKNYVPYCKQQAYDAVCQETDTYCMTQWAKHMASYLVEYLQMHQVICIVGSWGVSYGMIIVLQTHYYTPSQRSCWGVYWFHSVRLSVRPSFHPISRVHSVAISKV